MKKIFNSLLVIVLLLTPTAIKAETVIQNSVSVSANGGASTIKVKTVHNGEVIENTNISTTSPFHYKSEYEKGEVKSSVKTSIDKEESNQITRLNSLLNELRKLLTLYEKLLALQKIQ